MCNNLIFENIMSTFSAAVKHDHIAYEQPVTELVRHCIKIEKIILSLTNLIDQLEYPLIDLALNECLTLLRLCERADIKTKMIQWLLTLESKCRLWESSVVTEYNRLAEIKLQTNQLMQELNGQKSRFKLNGDPFLNFLSLQDLSSGVSALNAPPLQSWRMQPIAQCKEHFITWVSSVRSQISTAKFILQILRSSVHEEVVTAKNGFFQMSLDANSSTQLIRLTLNQPIVYPQMSIGKQRFSISFYRFDPSEAKFICQDLNTRQFHLSCCDF